MSHPINDNPPLISKCTQATEVSSVEQTSVHYLLATAQVYVVGPDGIKLFERALVDQCSQSSFMSTSSCQRLKLKKRTIYVPIGGVGNRSVAICKGLTKFFIEPTF